MMRYVTELEAGPELDLMLPDASMRGIRPSAGADPDFERMEAQKASRPAAVYDLAAFPGAECLCGTGSLRVVHRPGPGAHPHRLTCDTCGLSVPLTGKEATIPCPHCGRRTDAAPGATRRCRHCDRLHHWPGDEWDGGYLPLFPKAMGFEARIRLMGRLKEAAARAPHGPEHSRQERRRA